MHESVFRLAAPGLLAVSLLGSRAGAESPAQASRSPIEVTVEGRRSRAAPRDPTAASSVVRGGALRRPGATAAEIVERVPGVQVTRTGARSDLATASIRGATAAQTPVYVAGIRVNDDVSGTADLSTILLWMLDRAEIYRGNAPIDADQLGIGGAIFYEPRLPTRNEAGAGAALGSFGYRSLSLFGMARAAETGVLAAIRREWAENDYVFRDDRGTRFEPGDDADVRRQNADYRAYDAWAVARHGFGSRVRMIALLNAYDREQGVTGFSVIPALASRARTRRVLGGVSTALPCPNRGPASNDCKVELQTSALVASTTLTDPLDELGLLAARVENRGERVSQQATLRDRIDDRFEFALSARQSLEYLSIDDTSGVGLRARRSVSRGAALGTLDLTRSLRLHAVGAVDCHATRAPTSVRSCAVEPTGRVGLRWRVAPWLDLLGNVGRYTRVPTLAELYGVSPLVRGNAELLSESGIAADLGFRAETPDPPNGGVSAFFDGFGFVREVNDLIAYRRARFGVISPFNVQSARVYGVEASAGLDALKALSLEANATLLEPKDVSEDRTPNDVLPYRSRLVISQRTELYAEPAVPALKLDRVGVGARIFHRSSRYADPAGLIVIDGDVRVDFDLDVRLFDGHLALRVALENTFDSPSFDAVGLPLPGRAFYASAETFVF